MTDQTTTDHVLIGDALRRIAGRLDVESQEAGVTDELLDLSTVVDDLQAGRYEPADLTPVQYALLDAVKDVALAPEAPAAPYATEQLARMAGEAFGYPLPAPVVREGGLAGFLFGRPIQPTEQKPTATNSGESMKDTTDRLGSKLDVGPKHAAPVGEPEGCGVTTYPGRVVISREEAVELGLRPANVEQPTSAQIATETEGWPFKPGTIVRDEDGAEAEWLAAAPVGTVVAADTVIVSDLWARSAGEHWICLDGGSAWIGSRNLAARGPVRVVTVPGPQEACTDGTQDGPA